MAVQNLKLQLTDIVPATEKPWNKAIIVYMYSITKLLQDNGSSY